MRTIAVSPAQRAEIEKYAVAYKLPGYRMGAARKAMACDLLRGLPYGLCEGGSLLDVGCGRGEMLQAAPTFGFFSAVGVEAEPGLCLSTPDALVVQGVAWDLPVRDDSRDVVTCFDVLEHLLPDDQAPSLAEMRRVARGAVIVTAADYSHVVQGLELHPGRRSYADFDALIRTAFAGAESVAFFDGAPWKTRSAGWRVIL